MFSQKLLIFILILTVSTVFAQSSSQLIIPGTQINVARMITDNEEAYRSKIQIIERAEKSLKLMYYIYAEDETSSYLTQKLIKKAQDGIKVDILVDFLTNFTHYDLFKLMEALGRDKLTGEQNLHVRFYNRPTPVIIRDVTFMTATCRRNLPEVDCRAERKAQADAAYNEATNAITQNRPANLPILTSAFLSGVYSKQLSTVKTSLALGTGNDIAQVRKALAANSKKISTEELEQLKVLLKLIFDAKVKGSLSAKFQLAIAMGIHGEEIKPIIEMIEKVIPDTMKDDVENHNDWIHITDFLHHKMLLADDKIIQMGGRNIENSYHLNKKNSSKDKYIFRDTDMVFELNQTNSQLAKTFTNLFDSFVLTTDTKTIDEEMNFEYAMKPAQLGEAIMACVTQQGDDVAGCLKKMAPAIRIPDSKRLEITTKNLVAKSKSDIVTGVLKRSLPNQTQVRIGSYELGRVPRLVEIFGRGFSKN